MDDFEVQILRREHVVGLLPWATETELRPRRALNHPQLQKSILL